MGKLFPHNQETYDRVLSLFNEVNKVAVIQATGTGKGFLASEFIHVAFKGKNILVLVPNDAIKENYESNFNLDQNKNVKIRTYQTIMSWYERAKKGDTKTKEMLDYIINKVDLLITDELHRLGAPKWGEACKFLINNLDKRGKKILGLTATPVRYNELQNFDAIDENGDVVYIENREVKGRNMADEMFEGNIVQGVTLEQAVLRGILPSFKYVMGTYGYEKAIAETHEKLNSMRELYGEGNKSIRKIENNLKEIETKFGTEREHLRKLISGEIKSYGDNQKWIIFCSNSEQLKEIDDDLSYWFSRKINKFSNHFVNSLTDINLYSNYHGLSKNINDMNLKAFYDAKEGFHVIKCINKLNEGAHVPNVTGIIMLRGTLSPIVYLQQIGRALSAGSKNIPIIFDFIGNIENMNKVCEGQDAYYNTMRGFAENLQALKSSNYFVNERPEKEPEIIIKDNKVINLSRLFGEIQELLIPSSSIVWNGAEIAILDKYYPRGGVKAVKDEFSRNLLTNRSEDAIKAKARERGLVFDKNNAIINKDNTLRWTPEEDALILDAFETFLKTRSPQAIAAMLHKDKMYNREVDQIINRYQHIKNGRGAKNISKEYPRNGLRWDKDDIFILKDFYRRYNDFKEKFGVSGSDNPYYLEGMSKELRRSPEAILSKAQELGLYLQERKLDSSSSWREEEVKFLKENYGKIPMSELSEILGRSPSAIDKKVRREKLDKMTQNMKARSNQTPLQWNDFEIAYFNQYLGEDWDILCSKIPTKTPKQIKARVNKYCKEYGYKNPYVKDERFKKIS